MPVEPVTRTRHRTARVPVVDRTAEALQEALSREQETYPKHSPIVERIRATAEQIRHGSDIVAAGRGNEQKMGLGWSDSNQPR